MPNKTKVSFAVPTNLKNELQEHVIKDGYGLRGKSKWISEAVESLFEYNEFLELISYSDEMYGFDQIETAVLDYSLKHKLDKAVVEIRKEFPTLEGVKSRIMRTAVLQRILRS
ncbi:MAG: hypothetical protein CMF50_03555 [Legionellales bacterium]|nr:hypothetical protein [Legionellales bacterium]|tara:strand:- start:86 stop:424 length:339 start_codon:yes stop_codon:yes gene_type:complete